MRGFTRSAVIGILIISCGDNVTGPETFETCAQPDRIFAYPETLQLVIGSADRVWVDLGCAMPSGADIDWTIRDPAVASFGADPYSQVPVDEPTRVVQSLAPGLTYVVMEFRGAIDSIAVSVPDTVVMGAATYVAAGGDVSCAVTGDDTAWCWGVGSVLGEWSDPALGTCWGSLCSPMPVSRKAGALSVYTSTAHACTLNRFGGASCWGENSTGQVGVSTAAQIFDPVTVSGGGRYATLTLGNAHTCGLDSSGAAYCWGNHLIGRLGGDQRSRPVFTPEPVAGEHEFVSLDARGETTCGATDAGHLYCWGSLGNPTPTPQGAETCELSNFKGTPTNVSCSYVPLRMTLDADLSSDTIFVQASGACARAVSGTVFCYDPARGVYTPRAGLAPMATIVAGANHACGLTAAGSAWCWGSNGDGQLGDDTRTYRDEPVPVTGGHVFSQISVGGRHTCGLTTSQEVWCWGASDQGQAGASILSQPLVPVKVRGQA